MTKLANILNGWKNFIDKSETTETIAKSRAEECAKCSYSKKSILNFFNDGIKEIEGYKCSKCQCPLSPKVRSVKEKCPIGKW